MPTKYKAILKEEKKLLAKQKKVNILVSTIQKAGLDEAFNRILANYLTNSNLDFTDDDKWEGWDNYDE